MHIPYLAKNVKHVFNLGFNINHALTIAPPLCTYN